MALLFRRPKGTEDVLPEGAAHWRFLEGKVREVASRFGYGEVRTPTFEEAELFARSVGEDTDIVSKEMYTFEDRGGRLLALKPEGTAPVLRAYLEHGLHKRGGLTKLYYISPIFRYEKPQAGRYRQSHQFGAEAIGSGEPSLDVEVIDLALSIYRELGLSEISLLLNSIGCPNCRPSYRQELLKFARAHREELCEDCRRRMETNPLRLLDCKVEGCRRVMARAPVISQYLCSDCREHFEEVKRGLRSLGVAYREESRLVRGLDYYTRTVFEVVHGGLGAQNAICGGGRYDGLVEELGGPPTPALGFAGGVERTLLAMEAEGKLPELDERVEVFVAYLDDPGREALPKVLSELRRAGLRADGSYTGRSLKSQLRQADRMGARYAVILGGEELARGAAVVRDMELSEQREVPLDGVLKVLRGELG